MFVAVRMWKIAKQICTEFSSLFKTLKVPPLNATLRSQVRISTLCLYLNVSVQSEGVWFHCLRGVDCQDG